MIYILNSQYKNWIFAFTWWLSCHIQRPSIRSNMNTIFFSYWEFAQHCSVIYHFNKLTKLRRCRYTLQKYTFEKYTFGKYTFKKYTFRCLSLGLLEVGWYFFRSRAKVLVILWHIIALTPTEWKSESLYNWPTFLWLKNSPVLEMFTQYASKNEQILLSMMKQSSYHRRSQSVQSNSWAPHWWSTSPSREKNISQKIAGLKNISL